MESLVSPRVRLAVREALVASYLGRIEDLFSAEGFAPDESHDAGLSGVRRSRVEQFHANIDWADWAECRRYLRVVEAVLDDLAARATADPPYEHLILEERDRLLALLKRDGLVLDDDGAIRPRWEVLTSESLRGLPEDSAIPGHLRRMWDAVEEDPEHSIGAAKDAVESTMKHALAVLDRVPKGRPKFPSLVKDTQAALRLHPTTIAPDADGADSLVKALGALATVANSIDEVRNHYGAGHGKATKVKGLTARHSRFVARCTDAYVGMILDTLTSPTAPWRRDDDEAKT